MKRNYIVTMTYPAELFFSTDVERKIVQAAGNSHASGMGFGERDHSWYGLSKTEARAKKNRLAALKLGAAEYREDEN